METIPLESILVPLTAVLGLSLTVERVLEFAKNILERMIASKEGRAIPKLKTADDTIMRMEDVLRRERALREAEEEAKQNARKRQQLLEKLDSEKDLKKREEIKNELKALEDQSEFDERVSNATVLVEPATDPDDGKTLRVFILQLLGVVIGIVLVHFSGIQLFNSFLMALGSQIWLPKSLDFLLTGLLIGGGSAPMHVLVRFITERKFMQERDKEPAEDAPAEETNGNADKQPADAPKVITTPAAEESDWVDIPYNGGVDREKLENIHVRKQNPDLIVYHHTAMNSKSTFQDVVRVIKDRNWSTGYNCVIHYSGSIHPFCRWDRYGNHAIGYNMRSLGISFNGNFETNSAVPFSNPSGRMGPSRPSEAQLRAGARVVALWTFLYDIEIDFEKTIIPHNKISSKTCPGSSFPYDEFKKWVEHFHSKWSQSDFAGEKIAAYKLKPYLYV